MDISASTSLKVEDHLDEKVKKIDGHDGEFAKKQARKGFWPLSAM